MATFEQVYPDNKPLDKINRRAKRRIRTNLFRRIISRANWVKALSSPAFKKRIKWVFRDHTKLKP